MVDTKRFKLGPHAVHVVGQIARWVNNDQSRSVHAFDVATYVPLDLESIARILDSFVSDDVFKRVQGEDGLTYFETDHKEVDRLEPMDDDGFTKNLEALNQDDEWKKRVTDQHAIIRAASTGSDNTLDVAFFGRDVEMVPARLQSMLNDFAAEGFVSVQEEGFRFPKSVDYPKTRFEKNFGRIAQIEKNAEGSNQRIRLLFGLGLSILLILVIALQIAQI